MANCKTTGVFQPSHYNTWSAASVLHCFLRPVGVNRPWRDGWTGRMDRWTTRRMDEKDHFIPTSFTICNNVKMSYFVQGQKEAGCLKSAYQLWVLITLKPIISFVRSKTKCYHKFNCLNSIAFRIDSFLFQPVPGAPSSGALQRSPHNSSSFHYSIHNSKFPYMIAKPLNLHSHKVRYVWMALICIIRYTRWLFVQRNALLSGYYALGAEDRAWGPGRNDSRVFLV